MKNIKILIILIFFIIIWIKNTLAEENSTCEMKKWFEIYTCRVEQICEEYKPEKITYNPEKEYEKPEKFWTLSEAKEIYRTNVWYIYKCSLIQTQKNTLKLMKELIKEKTWKLDDRMWEKIKNQEKELDRVAAKIPCSLTEKENIQNKKNVLKEVTYEMCKYINYLEYLKLYSRDIETLIADDEKENFSPTEISKRMVNFIYEVEDEKRHTYRVYPIAYYAYSDYENNFPIHFLLEIVKEDFSILRENIYANLMPIAQVWYKIINAMIK